MSNHQALTTSTTETPRDNHACHVWMIEPTTPSGSVLTEAGLDQIVHHKYVSGTYTALDLALNPAWQWLTDTVLPLWLAPNAVTALGGLFCIASYILTAQHSFDMVPTSKSDSYIPGWVLVVNGLCLIVYYTLDCMDGKQARRTQSSSPLGQLFDHGVDCVANLSHLSLMQAVVQWQSPHQYLLIQLAMQLGFFQAQWEEYYTGSLPHAAGNLGTTEVLYGMALWSIASGLGWVDRRVYEQPVTTLPLLGEWLVLSPESVYRTLPGSKFILLGTNTMPVLEVIQVRHVLLLIWVYGFLVVSSLSVMRLVRHIWQKQSTSTTTTTTSHTMYYLASAVSKLLSPVILCGVALVAVMTDHSSSMTMNSTSTTTTTLVEQPPLDLLFGGVRYPSLTIGVCFCILTIKLVVYGMARMAYASVQYADLIPLICAVALVQYFPPSASSSEWQSCWRHLVYPLATVGYIVRLIWWTRSAVDPLCRTLHIQLFRISTPKQDQHKK